MTHSVAQEKYSDPNPVVRFVLRRFFDRVRAAVDAAAPASILDAGCGEGELVRRGVLPAGVPLTSLDLNPEALRAFREHAPRRDLVCASLTALPFAGGAFDAVLCLEVLEHLPQPAPALAELARVARQAVIVSVPYEPWFRLGNLLRGKHLGGWGNHPEHVQHWNPRTFRALLGSRFRRVRVVTALPWIIASCGK